MKSKVEREVKGGRKIWKIKENEKEEEVEVEEREIEEGRKEEKQKVLSIMMIREKELY